MDKLLKIGKLFINITRTFFISSSIIILLEIFAKQITLEIGTINTIHILSTIFIFLIFRLWEKPIYHSLLTIVIATPIVSFMVLILCNYFNIIHTGLAYLGDMIYLFVLSTIINFLSFNRNESFRECSSYTKTVKMLTSMIIYSIIIAIAFYFGFFDWVYTLTHI